MRTAPGGKISRLSHGCQARRRIRKLRREKRTPQLVSLRETVRLVQGAADDDRGTGYGILIAIVMISAIAMTEAMKKNGCQKRAVMLNGIMVKSRGVDADPLLVGVHRVTKPSDPVSLQEVGRQKRCRKRVIFEHSWAPWLNSVSSCCKRKLSASGLSADV